MRVLLSGDSLAPRMSGVGQYTSRLIAALAERGDTEVWWLGGTGLRRLDGGSRPAQGDFGHAASSLTAPLYLRALRKSRRGEEFGAVHGTNFRMLGPAGRRVVTVHDLSILDLPHLHPAARVRRLAGAVQESLELAEMILVPSAATGQRVLDRVRRDPATLVVTPLAPAGDFRPRKIAECRPLLDRLGLGWRGYGLVVGTIEPRKNLARLLAAWRGLPRALSRRYPLVVAGAPGWKAEADRRLIAEGVSEGWVIRPGYVSPTDLPLLVAAARLSLYPSVYEGFGLPVLEAMASGTPVLTSRTDALVELTGAPERAFPAEDVSQMRAMIEAALVAPPGAGPALERAGAYSWQRCAAATRAAYARLPGHPPSRAAAGTD